MKIEPNMPLLIFVPQQDEQKTYLKKKLNLITNLWTFGDDLFGLMSINDAKKANTFGYQCA